MGKQGIWDPRKTMNRGVIAEEVGQPSRDAN